MFETFNKQFESAFRVIFIIWVCFWGTLDLGTLLYQYASFNNNTPSSSDLGFWWINTLGQVITVAVGITLLFFMVNVPNAIHKTKKIGNIGMMTSFAVIYYLFVTGIKIFASAIFKAESFATDFVYLSAWLFPSIILLVVHIFYFQNLRKYNEELAVH